MARLVGTIAVQHHRLCDRPHGLDQLGANGTGMETILMLIDAVLVAGLGGWMAFAVADNWLHPKLNESGVAMVVGFDLMAEEYPDDYSEISYRRITNPKTIRLMFQCIRMAETLSALALLLSSAALILASAGMAPAPAAHAMALVSTAFFTMIWAGFITGGNYFAYWYCHQWSQSNHFMLMFWGLLVLIVQLL